MADIEWNAEAAQLRGHCKVLAEAAVANDPTLRLVRGWYHCPVWGAQQHWWTVRLDGSIYDPTAMQFPSGGLGKYDEFDGIITCANCGKTVPEAEADIIGNGHYAVCSHACYGQFVGVL